MINSDVSGDGYLTFEPRLVLCALTPAEATCCTTELIPALELQLNGAITTEVLVSVDVGRFSNTLRYVPGSRKLTSRIVLNVGQISEIVRLSLHKDKGLHQDRNRARLIPPQRSTCLERMTSGTKGPNPDERYLDLQTSKCTPYVLDISDKAHLAFATFPRSGLPEVFSTLMNFDAFAIGLQSSMTPIRHLRGFSLLTIDASHALGQLVSGCSDSATTAFTFRPSRSAKTTRFTFPQLRLCAPASDELHSHGDFPTCVRATFLPYTTCPPPCPSNLNLNYAASWAARSSSPSVNDSSTGFSPHQPPEHLSFHRLDYIPGTGTSKTSHDVGDYIPGAAPERQSSLSLTPSWIDFQTIKMSVATQVGTAVDTPRHAYLFLTSFQVPFEKGRLQMRAGAPIMPFHHRELPGIDTFSTSSASRRHNYTGIAPRVAPVSYPPSVLETCLNATVNRAAQAVQLRPLDSARCQLLDASKRYRLDGTELNKTVAPGANHIILTSRIVELQSHHNLPKIEQHLSTRRANYEDAVVGFSQALTGLSGWTTSPMLAHLSPSHYNLALAHPRCQPLQIQAEPWRYSSTEYFSTVAYRQLIRSTIFRHYEWFLLGVFARTSKLSSQISSRCVVYGNIAHIPRAPQSLSFPDRPAPCRCLGKYMTGYAICVPSARNAHQSRMPRPVWSHMDRAMYVYCVYASPFFSTNPRRMISIASPLPDTSQRDNHQTLVMLIPQPSIRVADEGFRAVLACWRILPRDYYGTRGTKRGVLICVTRTDMLRFRNKIPRSAHTAASWSPKGVGVCHLSNTRMKQVVWLGGDGESLHVPLAYTVDSGRRRIGSTKSLAALTYVYAVRSRLIIDFGRRDDLSSGDQMWSPTDNMFRAASRQTLSSDIDHVRTGGENDAVHVVRSYAPRRGELPLVFLGSPYHVHLPPGDPAARRKNPLFTLITGELSSRLPVGTPGKQTFAARPPFLHYCVLWHVPPYIPPLPGIFSTLSSSNSLSFPFFSRASPPVTQSQRTHLRPHVQRYDWLFTSTPQPRPYASICTTNDERQGSESLLAARAGFGGRRRRSKATGPSSLGFSKDGRQATSFDSTALSTAAALRQDQEGLLLIFEQNAFLSSLSIRHLAFLLWEMSVSRASRGAGIRIQIDDAQTRSLPYPYILLHLSLPSYRGDAVRCTRCTRLGTQGLGAAPAYGRPHLIITSWVRGRRRNVFPLMDHTGIDIASIESCPRNGRPSSARLQLHLETRRPVFAGILFVKGTSSMSSERARSLAGKPMTRQDDSIRPLNARSVLTCSSTSFQTKQIPRDARCGPLSPPSSDLVVALSTVEASHPSRGSYPSTTINLYISSFKYGTSNFIDEKNIGSRDANFWDATHFSETKGRKKPVFCVRGLVIGNAIDIRLSLFPTSYRNLVYLLDVRCVQPKARGMRASFGAPSGWATSAFVDTMLAGIEAV
ncbi:uncharacterized protein CLUP02_03330 [Colletotrichum lupini]|uniref:Uncharacterized protein n=1 Tax=Colletotrichum lupini TaxID=145971 RepID=A0A9Q8WBP9_9PEZI|nr:uncharacterized protein CLUP02_03330 [Colletotrichum lupini]UQC77858.1 hypothetical protein CLUP02_03330 [Colletotrichum lupini]